jgi:hypothetical protein
MLVWKKLPNFSTKGTRPRWGRRLPAAVLVLGLLGLPPAGCATDKVGPGKGSGYVVWIAQEFSGSVHQAITGTPVVGATVTISAGFQLDTLIPIAFGKTGADGSYDILRAQATGVPGDFWWFAVNDPSPVTLFVQAQIQQGNYLPAYPRVTLQRTPSRDPPGSNFGAYAITLSAVMTLAQQP